MADDGWEGHILRVITSANLLVEGVDGSGNDAHQQFADTHLRYCHILQFKAVRAAKFLENDRFHFSISR